MSNNSNHQDSDDDHDNGYGNDDDGFANGYYDHNPNGAADDALSTASERRSKNDDDDSDVIDFNWLTIETEGEATTANSDNIWGSYTEDGYTFQWETYDWDPDGTAGVEVPFADLDGDGDLEFTTIKTYESALDYSEAWGVFTNDEGESFGLIDANIFNDNAANNEYYWEDGVYLSYSTVDGDDVQTAYAYSYDAEEWTYYYYSSELEDGVLQVEELSGTGTFEYILEEELFDDMYAFEVYVWGDMAIGDVELGAV